jgi:hypothetical protein
VIAYIIDGVAIARILDCLGLSPPKEPKPPPAVREVVRVPLNEEGREIGDSP